MPEVGFLNLFVVAVIAFGVPLLIGLAPWLRVPGPVLEIVAGVVLGPGVLGWVHADLPVQVLAVVGSAFSPGSPSRQPAGWTACCCSP